MALLVAWVSLGACVLLSLACFGLYVDRAGQRRALAALQRQLAGLRREIASLVRAGDPAPTGRSAMLPAAPLQRAPTEAPRKVERSARVTLPGVAPPTVLPAKVRAGR